MECCVLALIDLQTEELFAEGWNSPEGSLFHGK